MTALPLTAETTRSTVGWMPGVEALRGIAALMVVVHHCWSLSSQPRFHGYWLLEGFGSYGVNIFFVLSAFLLTPHFWRADWTLRDFWVRRLFRIYPAYAFNVIVLFLFFVPSASLLSHTGVKQVLANLTFTHYLWPSTASSFFANGALWTLTIEMFLYLALPLMALAVAKAPIAATTVLIAIGTAWRILVGAGGDGLREFYFGSTQQPPLGIQSLFIARQFIGFVPLFAVGIAARWYFDRTLRQRTAVMRLRPNLWMLGALLVPGALMLVFVERASQYTHWAWFSTFDLVSAVAVVPVMWLAAAQWPAPTRADRVGEWLGARSYGIYLWHFPLILVFYERGTAFLPPDLTWWPLRVGLVLATTLLFASFSYTHLERPAQEMGRRLTRRQSSTASTVLPSGDPPVS